MVPITDPHKAVLVHQWVKEVQGSLFSLSLLYFHIIGKKDLVGCRSCMGWIISMKTSWEWVTFNLHGSSHLQQRCPHHTASKGGNQLPPYDSCFVAKWHQQTCSLTAQIRLDPNGAGYNQAAIDMDPEDTMQTVFFKTQKWVTPHFTFQPPPINNALPHCQWTRE